MTLARLTLRHFIFLPLYLLLLVLLSMLLLLIVLPSMLLLLCLTLRDF